MSFKWNQLEPNLTKKDYFTNDSLSVLLKFSRKLDSGEMRLKQNVGLDVRIVVLRSAGQLVGKLVAQVAQDGVFAVSDLY